MRSAEYGYPRKLFPLFALGLLSKALFFGSPDACTAPVHTLECPLRVLDIANEEQQYNIEVLVCMPSGLSQGGVHNQCALC